MKNAFFLAFIVQQASALSLCTSAMVIRAFQGQGVVRVVRRNKNDCSCTRVAGYKIEKIQLIQRYNFLNHLKWFLEGKPEGHVTYQDTNDKDIIKCYNKYLIKKDLADTILLEATVNK